MKVIICFVILMCYKILEVDCVAVISAPSTAEYDALLVVLRGDIPPKPSRPTNIKTAVRKLQRWRTTHVVTLGKSGTSIYIDGKKLLSKEGIGSETQRTYKQQCGGSCRKIAASASAGVVGVSRRAAGRVIGSMKNVRNLYTLCLI